MKNIRNTFAAATLMTVLAFGTTFANAGLLISDLQGNNPEPCTVKDGIVVAGVTGIVVAGITGIVVAGLTGIVVAGANDAPTENCGIVVAG